ncbi:response regulator [Kitasatospora sp. NPDC006697]|uniref:response regulator n=1 Tax=Kitasatospora sp. NPDC006697 TaxID=3364020 RepID=UPI00368FAAD4
MSTRVLLVDDQPLVRAALEMAISGTEDVEVAGEAGSGAEAVRLAAELRPDVVVMDIRMRPRPDDPQGPAVPDGIAATRLITAAPDAPRVLVLTTFDEDENVYAALRAGASGFLVKDMALADILAAIRVVAAGEALLAPSVTRRLIAEFAGRPEPAARPAPQTGAISGLTDRERELLALIGQGRSNSEIAADLVISMGTVKTYVTRLLAKTGARDRVQLAILAHRCGLVSLDG